ncbi:unnamed protein product [Durusdinium trenchii]|uniref:Mitochondrial n=2 Tax=Durusdinium trenchii TaxID=1381693 RepID=A0ABP0QH57_9DINO
MLRIAKVAAACGGFTYASAGGGRGSPDPPLAPVKDAEDLLDCRSLKLAASCPITSDKNECEATTVEYSGIRYMCYFTENTYGSISATLKANRCNVDMNSKVCRQVW